MKNVALVFIVVATIIAGCEGPVGPQGDQGPKGDTGEVGPSGVPGVTSRHVVLRTEDFESGAGSGVAIARYEDPDITQSVVDNGLVAMYYNTLTSPVILDIGQESVVLTHAFALGELRVIVIASDGVNRASVFSGDTVRFVIVDPSGG